MLALAVARRYADAAVSASTNPSSVASSKTALRTFIMNQPLQSRRLETEVGSGYGCLPLGLGKDVRKRWEVTILAVVVVIIIAAGISSTLSTIPDRIALCSSGVFCVRLDAINHSPNGICAHHGP